MGIHLSRYRWSIFLIEYQIKVGIFQRSFVQAAVSAGLPTRGLTIQGKTFPQDKLVRPFYQRDWFSLPPPRGVDGVILWLIFVSCGVVVVVTVNSAARQAPRLIYVGMCACPVNPRRWKPGGNNSLCCAYLTGYSRLISGHNLCGVKFSFILQSVSGSTASSQNCGLVVSFVYEKHYS